MEATCQQVGQAGEDAAGFEAAEGGVLGNDGGADLEGVENLVHGVAHGGWNEGETDAPAGLKLALKNANRLQDILFEETRVGRTGNEILAATLAKMMAVAA